MALWVCLDCTTAYAVGLFRCPRCHGTKFAEDGSEEAEMAKITLHGGPSIDDPNTPDEEEVSSSPGSSSQTSTKKQSTTPGKSEQPSRSRARTTGSRSKKAQTDSPSAASTDGGQTAPSSAKASDDKPTGESKDDDKK
jgi:hypothetical protein